MRQRTKPANFRCHRPWMTDSLASFFRSQHHAIQVSRISSLLVKVAWWIPRSASPAQNFATERSNQNPRKKKTGNKITKPRKSKDQTLPIGSRESFTWIILKTILCLVLDFQGKGNRLANMNRSMSSMIILKAQFQHFRRQWNGDLLINGCFQK